MKRLLLAVLLILVAASDELPRPTRYNQVSGWVQVDSFVVERVYALLNDPEDWTEKGMWAVRTQLWEGDMNQLTDLIRSTGNDTIGIWTVEALEEAGLLFGGHVVTGIEEELPPTRTGFHAWPNPSDGNITVRTSKAGELRLFNVAGQLLRSTPIPAGETLLFLNLSSGVYFAVFGSQARKLVVMR